MKILITGGTGFVGTQLTSRLIKDGHEVTILTRSLKGAKGSSPGISYLEGDPTQKGPWQEAIKNHEVIINLAGASIFSRWTDEQKKAIRESRVNTTRNIVEGIPSHPERTLLSLAPQPLAIMVFVEMRNSLRTPPQEMTFYLVLLGNGKGRPLRSKRRGREWSSRGLVLFWVKKEEL